MLILFSPSSSLPTASWEASKGQAPCHLISALVRLGLVSCLSRPFGSSLWSRILNTGRTFTTWGALKLYVPVRVSHPSISALIDL